MKTISCKEMQDMDYYAINNIGIPSIVLMENAALKVLKNINLDQINSYTIVCGTGNNGGDGLAIARHLVLKNKDVHLLIIGNPAKGSKDFNINLDILKNMDVSFTNIKDETALSKLGKSLNNNQITIDAIFGIGISRDVEGIYSSVIKLINKNSKNILSVDIPSGLDGDTGKVLGICVKASKTVTFHMAKAGLENAETYTGNLIVESIGIPDKVTGFVLS